MEEAMEVDMWEAGGGKARPPRAAGRKSLDVGVDGGRWSRCRSHGEVSSEREEGDAEREGINRP